MIQQTCTPIPAPPHEVLSPDGQWAAYAEAYNLFIRHMTTGEVRQLTYDGEPYYRYGTNPEVNNKINHYLENRLPKASVLWSPDSKKLLTPRVDERNVLDQAIIQSIPSNEKEVRPVLHTERYAMPGDIHVPQIQMYIANIEKQEALPVQSGPYTPSGSNPIIPQNGWSSDSRQAYYLEIERGHRSAQLIVVDAETGATHAAVEETSETFIFLHIYYMSVLHKVRAGKEALLGPNFRMIQDRSILWNSERNGWAHLYIVDPSNKDNVRPLTTGEWGVQQLIDVDEKRGWVYFLASGKEPGRNPYYHHLYRARLDGSELTLLTPEDADHNVVLSPDYQFFVDSYSRVDTAPVSVLRRTDGSYVCELEQANIQPLLDEGYQMAERFIVKAYAQLGFATIIMDGRGTPFRSKKMHDYSAGNLGFATGLIDHVHALPQLAEQFPFLDTERVGIVGSSGGGYGAARAILQHPNVYKVVVGSAGNHDQLLYSWVWGEMFQGLVDPRYPERYANQDNAQLAGNLQGKLMLAHGDVDNNVHAAHTLRLVDALIKADKNFDLIMMPNVGHGIADHPYFIRRMWDYFVTYLLGAEHPKEFPLPENNAAPIGTA